MDLIGQGIKVTNKNVIAGGANALANLQKKFVVKATKVGADEEDIDFKEVEYEELKPLEYDEIKNALKIIDELHPMKDIPVYKLFPWACFCLKSYT